MRVESRSPLPEQPKAEQPHAPQGPLAPAVSCATNGAARRVRSSELLGDGKELIIVHQQREYRLRVTSNGKLILTA